MDCSTYRNVFFEKINERNHVEKSHTPPSVFSELKNIFQNFKIIQNFFSKKKFFVDYYFVSHS